MNFIAWELYNKSQYKYPYIHHIFQNILFHIKFIKNIFVQSQNKIKLNQIKLLHHLTKESHHLSNPLFSCNTLSSQIKKIKKQHHTKRRVS